MSLKNFISKLFYKTKIIFQRFMKIFVNILLAGFEFNKLFFNQRKERKDLLR